MIAAVHAPLARVLAGRTGLRALDGPERRSRWPRSSTTRSRSPS